MSGLGLDRKVEGTEVTYTYFLRGYQGEEVKLDPDRTIQSSSSCAGSFVWGPDVYKDEQWLGKVSKWSRHAR